MLSAKEREEVESLELVIQPANGDQFSVDLTRFDDESIQCLVYKRPAGSVTGANPQPTRVARVTPVEFAELAQGIEGGVLLKEASDQHPLLDGGRVTFIHVKGGALTKRELWSFNAKEKPTAVELLRRFVAISKSEDLIPLPPQESDHAQSSSADIPHAEAQSRPSVYDRFDHLEVLPQPFRDAGSAVLMAVQKTGLNPNRYFIELRYDHEKPSCILFDLWDVRAFPVPPLYVGNPPGSECRTVEYDLAKKAVTRIYGWR